MVSPRVISTQKRNVSLILGIPFYGLKVQQVCLQIKKVETTKNEKVIWKPYFLIVWTALKISLKFHLRNGNIIQFHIWKTFHPVA